MKKTSATQTCHHPTPDEASRQAARKLQEVFRRFRRMMKRPAAGHKKMAEMSVMKTVAFHHVETGEGIRISEIASQLKIAPPTVTQFINNLEKAGWVARSMDPQDRRSVLVRLTEEGKRCHERFEADMLHLFEGLTLHLGLEDAAHLTRILDKSFAYLEEATQHHHGEDPHTLTHHGEDPHTLTHHGEDPHTLTHHGEDPRTLNPHDPHHH